MHQQEFDQIVNRLPRGRTLFHYFRDRYALMLLEAAAGNGCSVAQLKSSRYGALLRKPIVRQILAAKGSARVDRSDFQSLWVEPHLTFRLSVGRWPLPDTRWCRCCAQMARPGVNLVLQLNLPQQHVQEMERALDESRDELQWACHPVASSPDFTLSWARIDYDADRREALIEEIQSDWVRDVADNGKSEVIDDDGRWKRYMTESLQPYARLWSEATLAATLWFLRTELNVERVFYYTHATGNALKRFYDMKPPRSLYDDLPRRFCFERTHNGPLFLRDSRPTRNVRKAMRDPELQWFRMNTQAA